MSIEEYIRNIALQYNSKFNREIFTEDRIIRLKDHFSKIESDLEKIKPRIDNFMYGLIEPLEVQDVEYNPEQLDTNLKTNNQGTYLSSIMTTALSLVNCSNIDEINEWIDSVPNLYTEELYELRNYTPEELDIIKRDLFTKYQNSMISLESTQRMGKDGVLANRYALHKKIEGLHISTEEEQRLGDLALSQGIPALYKEIETICNDKYKGESGKEIYTKIVNYFTSDFENFNSSTYDQIVAFNEQIKSNIERCKSEGGDYQLVISSISYGNTTNKRVDGTYEYNYGVSNMGQNLAEKLGSSYRVRSAITRLNAEEMKEKNLSQEETIQVLRDSLKVSLESLNNNIKDDKRKRTYELFNELIEIQKADKDYQNVWEKNFGITMEDMIEKVVMPNANLIQELKTKNVDFMYNETMLQESQEKRNKVAETFSVIEEKAPGLISVFGNQDHTFCADYRKENIGELRATADFMTEMSKKVGIECTERDLYFSKTDLKRFKELGLSKDEVLRYKQFLLNKNGKISKTVPYQRECEWTTISNISGEFTRDGISPSEESYMGKYTKISDMGIKDNSARVSKEIAAYNNWKNQMTEVKKDKAESNIQQSNKSNELGQMLKQPESKSSPKILNKSIDNSGSVGILELAAIITIALGVAIVFTILNIVK